MIHLIGFWWLASASVILFGHENDNVSNGNCGDIISQSNITSVGDIKYTYTGTGRRVPKINLGSAAALQFTVWKLKEVYNPSQI